MVINPLLIANYAKLSLRKTKTDKKDARTIAKFLLDHRQEISQLCVSQDLNLFLDILKHFIYFLYLSCLPKELDAEA